MGSTTPERSAAEMVEDLEHGSRSEGYARWLIPLIAAGWSLFQLALPSVIAWKFPIDSIYIRTVHLAFAIALVFLCYPTIKRWRLKGPLRWLSDKRRIPVLDLVIAMVAAAAACYLAWDFEAMSGRAGLPLTRDIVAGIVLLVLLLEAARRSLGLALPIVACFFIFYAMTAEQFPSAFAFKSVSLDRLMSQLTLTTEGIYGVPLYVSASTVFLFVLFGAFLEKTGGGSYFVRLAFSLLGTFRGGPAKAAVLASGFTGLVSGSSIANVVTTGTFTIPLMKRAGYPGVKAGAIEVAASTNGQLMPPIMGAAAFIIAEYCGLPYFDVVKAAFVPAVISYCALIYITHLEACKLGLKGLKRGELPPFRETLKEGLHFFIPLTLLIYLLVVRRYTPEYSAFWSILVLVATTAVHNTWQRLKDRGTTVASRFGAALRQTGHEVWDSLVTGGRNMMSIGVAVAAAGIIVGVVSLGPGQRITEMVDFLAGGNIYAILFMTAIASLILGLGLPTTANYIIMASLTATVITNLAGDAGYVVPIIAAHLFVFYFGILADDTPPVGLAAYAASAISRAHPIKTGIQGFTYDMRTALLPFMFFFNTDLLLWNVESYAHGAYIFFTGLIGMFAFTSAIQRWLLVRNRVWEMPVLLLSTLLLLQPLFFIRFFNVHHTVLGDVLPLTAKPFWHALGLACFAGVIFAQSLRRQRASAGE